MIVLGGIATTLLGIFVFHKAKQVVNEVEEDPVAATAKVLAAAIPTSSS
jgi:hypothetical protein